MQRWEKQKKAARDLVRARTLAKSVTRNGTENGTTTLARRLHSVGANRAWSRPVTRNGTENGLGAFSRQDRHAVELVPEDQDQLRTLSPSQPCPYMVTHVSDLSGKTQSVRYGQVVAQPRRDGRPRPTPRKSRQKTPTENADRLDATARSDS